MELGEESCTIYGIGHVWNEKKLIDRQLQPQRYTPLRLNTLFRVSLRFAKWAMLFETLRMERQHHAITIGEDVAAANGSPACRTRGAAI